MQHLCIEELMLLDYRLYGPFTMETILATAFGRVIEVQKGQSNELTKAATVILSGTQENRISSMSFLIMLFSKCWSWWKSCIIYIFFQAGNVPWLQPVVKQFTRGISYQKATNVLVGTSIAVIHERRREKSKNKVVAIYYPFFTQWFISTILCSIRIYFSWWLTPQ